MTEVRKPRVALIYDFDGTLSPGNMQEYDFIPELGMTKADFWDEVRQRAEAQEADQILSYMTLMLEKANISTNKVKVTQDAFFEYGVKIELYRGLDSWFDRINNFALSKDLEPEHYIVSSGIREMILGTSISDRFTRIYACSFIYDKYNVAKWPGMAINYTTKTQFLFRISKGGKALDVWDNEAVNQHYSPQDIEIPFTNMVYFGDGSTDIPCMKLVKSKGGHSVAVHDPTSQPKPVHSSLLEQDRVHLILPADYSEGSALETFTKAAIEKIASVERINQLVRGS